MNNFFQDSYDEIRLSMENGVWVASFMCRGEPCTEVIKYFKTHRIPTPFTGSTSSSEVLRKIYELNVNVCPGMKVVVI